MLRWYTFFTTIRREERERGLCAEHSGSSCAVRYSTEIKSQNYNKYYLTKEK